MVKALPYGRKVQTRVVEDLPTKSLLHGTEKVSTSELSAIIMIHISDIRFGLVRYDMFLQVQGSNFVFPYCANAGESKFKLLLGIKSESLRTAFSRQLEKLHCLRADDERCASIWSTSSNPSDESQAHQLLDNFLKRRDEVNKIDNPYLRALIARYLG